MQEKQEREAAAAEEGWTVVVSKTGRKKTTDDTGIAVGAVSAAAVMERAKKKQKTDVSVDFYRFQKREARRNGKPDVLWFELYLWSHALTFSTSKTYVLALKASLCIQQVESKTGWHALTFDYINLFT